MVYSDYHFQFTSKEENDYYLVLDNSLGWVTPKDVSVEIHIKTPLSREEIVELQAKAIYDTIKQNGMNYVHMEVNFDPGNFQTIKMPSDTIKDKRGSYIDVAILFASCFEAISFESAIAITPGHAFVGIRKWGDSNDYFFIETTDVSKHNFDQVWISQQDVFSKYGKGLKIVDVKKARDLGIDPIR